MERTEVCLVEAKQFEQGAVRVVVPTLWGYTEEARRVKKAVTVQKSSGRRAWNYDGFAEDVRRRLDAKMAAEVLSFYDFCQQLEGIELRWGNGKERGSFSAVDPKVTHRSLFTVLSDGELWLNFNWLGETESERHTQSRFYAGLAGIPQLALPTGDDSKGRVFTASKWLPVVEQIKAALLQIWRSI